LLVYDHTNLRAARTLSELATKASATEDEEYALRLVADLDPFDVDAHTRLGRRLLAKGEYPAALVELQATVALGAVNPAETHTDLAETFLKLGRRADARREALLALRVAPTFARAQDVLIAAGTP
jgi:Flp pilus assembly protein TadD